MNVNNNQSSQEIILKNRKALTITGVNKMHSLDPNTFDIETSLGRLKVEGSNLEMLSLDIQKGVLVIEGEVAKINYMDNIKTKESFLGKLFK